MMYIDHTEDDPDDPDMVIAYYGYGGPNQIATRIERKMILEIALPEPIVDWQEIV